MAPQAELTFVTLFLLDIRGRFIDAVLYCPIYCLNGLEDVMSRYTRVIAITIYAEERCSPRLW